MSGQDPVDPRSLEPALTQLLDFAKSHGADKADAIATHGRSLGVVSRGGKLEDVDNSEGRDIGLRVIIGQKQACVSSSDLSASSLEQLADRAVAMARLAPDDPYCGLADPQDLTKETLELDLFDDTEFKPAELLSRAQELESAILSVNGVQQAEGSNASWSTSAMHLVTSDGFSQGWRGSSFGMSGLAIAAQDGQMERDYDVDGARHFADLRDIKSVGRRAGERAVARLGGRQLPSGSLPVIYDRRLSRTLISSFLGAINGNAIARGTSFLKDKLGETIFGEHITITDDPHMRRGQGSHPWDGEGVGCQKIDLIENGILKTWLLNSSAAKQLNMTTTGHASRGISSPPGISSSNTYMQAGDITPEELMRSAGDAFLVTDMFGPSLNANTGDYRRCRM